MEFPEVWPVILIDWRRGTPEATVPAKVRDQRASAAFWITSPILKGIFSLSLSHCGRPHSLFFHWKNPTMLAIVIGTQMKTYPVTKSEKPTVTRVTSGSDES